MIKNKNNL